MRLLLVEDEHSLAEIVALRLKKEGYSVDIAMDGEDGLHFARMAEYDLILLDIMLPKIDGISVLKTMRAEKILAPVLLLTAKDSIDDRVIGLDAGADDYLVKPYSLEELLARVRALLRRKGEHRDTVLTEGDLMLDTQSHQVSRAGVDVEMTSKEYSILEYMMRNKGQVLSREQIVAHAWSFDFDCGSNIIDVYIRYLRGKIDDRFEHKLLHTIRGSGYLLKCKE